MGQILGLGKSGGDKSKQTSTPQAPSWLDPSYKQMASYLQSNLPALQSMTSGVMSGDRSTVAPYAAPTAAGYTTPMASGYTNTMASTFQPMAASYKPIAGSQQSFLSGMESSAAPAMAPYALQQKNALAALQRQTPAGGGREAARGNILAQSGATMAQAQAQAAQNDVQARNAARQKDIEVANAYAKGDIEAANTLAQMDIATYMKLRGEDVQATNQLQVQDIQNQNALQVQDIQNQNAMMQKVLALYAQMAGGINPAAMMGQTTERKDAGSIGVPFANITTGYS